MRGPPPNPGGVGPSPVSRLTLTPERTLQRMEPGEEHTILRDIRTRAEDPSLVEHIDALIAYAEREMPPGSFLCFTGD